MRNQSRAQPNESTCFLTMEKQRENRENWQFVCSLKIEFDWENKNKAFALQHLILDKDNYQLFAHCYY